MEEDYCFLCQEPKSIVGHFTEKCPEVKCRNCGQKGHTAKDCSNSSPKTLEKPLKLEYESQDFTRIDKGKFDNLSENNENFRIEGNRIR